MYPTTMPSTHDTLITDYLDVTDETSLHSIDIKHEPSKYVSGIASSERIGQPSNFVIWWVHVPCQGNKIINNEKGGNLVLSQSPTIVAPFAFLLNYVRLPIIRKLG